MPEGAQSPPPEQSSGKQLHDPPASGQGTNDTPSNKEKTNKSALDNLTSNPKGPLDDEVAKKFPAKHTKMDQ